MREACWCGFGKSLKDEKFTGNDIPWSSRGREWEEGKEARVCGGERWHLRGLGSLTPAHPHLPCSGNLRATWVLISRIQNISRGQPRQVPAAL